ncbi:hypothetical protein [Aestuariibacter sp. A3R04]|uniref:hypothetical protein n=1 Tax=Aestuariibacter sp. A3R04 TaxID=2841571 RepID=UPI001C0908B5|nr:hypothetical protein [Aestuariibacter sp. A3R04]MBU3022441.1 hypothetical protein [Aestuariibacter sp. A3R04]
MRIRMLLPFALLLSGCAAIEREDSAPVEPVETNTDTPVLEEDDSLCLVEPTVERFESQCDLFYWVNLWVQADNTRWPERRDAIATLSDSTEDTLKKIILSLPVDTPYQSRLRAQHWLTGLEAKINPAMLNVVNSLVKSPNGEMLELESAMVILNRVNTDKEKQLSMLEKELALQTKKLEELLKVEATLMDKNRSTQR